MKENRTSYGPAILFGVKNHDYSDKSIIDLFENQVKATSGNIAIEDGKRKVTYQELNSMVNVLALHIRKSLSPQNNIVAIFMENSIELIVSILATLKAEGIYVPLDSGNNLNRIHDILKDCRPSVILTDTARIDKVRVDSLSDMKLNYDILNIVTQEEGALSEQYNVVNVKHFMENYIDSNDVQFETTGESEFAYIIYTSGSTGNPKGVLVTQKGLVNYLTWAKSKYLFCDKAVTFALYTSIGFDLTVTSIFVPLLSGNKIKIYRSSNSAYSVHKIIKDNEVDVLKLTPTHLGVLENKDLSKTNLKMLIVGGEALKVSLARKIHNAFSGNIIIYNEYGPTEATVGCMIHKYDSTLDNDDTVPIGKPIENVNIYVLDDKMKPVNYNTIGEIYVSGDCVANGYFNSKELTDKKFTRDPFTDGLIMYRTHDLAILSSNNTVRFLGRSDRQVKLRGYRIELEEVESHLYRVQGVKESAVVLKNENSNNPYIKAYVVLEDGCSIKNIKELIKNKLPGYMMPEIFEEVSSLPQTSSGKVDRKKLSGR